MDKNQKEKEKRETPIVDGDARPDMPVSPEIEKRNKEKVKNTGKDEKFESERSGDLNSLEDYKDAK